MKRKGSTPEQLERMREANETRKMSRAEHESMIVERYLRRKWEREQAAAVAFEEANKVYFKMVVGLVSHVVVNGSISAGLGNALLVIESKNERSD